MRFGGGFGDLGHGESESGEHAVFAAEVIVIVE